MKTYYPTANNYVLMHSIFPRQMIHKINKQINNNFLGSEWPFALAKIQEFIGLPGILFEGEYKFTVQMVSDFYVIDERTVKRYLEK